MYCDVLGMNAQNEARFESYSSEYTGVSNTFLWVMEKQPDLPVSMYQRARYKYQYLQAVCYVDIFKRHSHLLVD